MKKHLLTLTAIAFASAGFAATLSPIADTYVQNGSSSDYSAGTALQVKLQRNPSSNNRVTLIKFDGTGIGNNVKGVTLTLTRSGGIVSSTSLYHLFGLADGSAFEDFNASTITWDNCGFTDITATNNVNQAVLGEPVATVVVPGGTPAGATITFSGLGLDAFLNANANAVLSFVVTSAKDDPTSSAQYASSENTSYQVPTLYYEDLPPFPEIVVNPVSATNYTGNTVQLTANGQGALPLTYQWKAGAVGSGVYTNVTEGLLVSGANTSVLTVTRLSPETADYVLEVSNAHGAATSLPATVEFQAAPTLPGSVVIYPGGNVTFTVPEPAFEATYQWRKNGGNLSDGANVWGTSSSALVITNVTAGNVGSYDVVVTTTYGSYTSQAATLALADLPAPGSYAERILNHQPVAHWRFNETTLTTAYDFMGGHNAVYGPMSSSSWGPADPEFPRFEASNTGVYAMHNLRESAVTVPASSALNLNTNTVTITAWVNPSGLISVNNGIVMHRDAGHVAGLQINPNGWLGYNWNDDSATWSWNSNIELPVDVWSLVALVVTPTDATVHMYNAYSQLTATHVHEHAPAPFDGALSIGDDPISGNENRTFNGTIDEVAVFNRALSASEISGLYFAALGQDQFPPTISAHPQSLSLYEQQTATFNVQAAALPAPSYQWKKWNGSSFENVVNGGRISGATTATLTISNIVATDAADYMVTVANSLSYMDSTPATLTVLPVSPAENITMSVIQGSGRSWETGADWSDGLPSSQSSIMKPGSQYFILPNAAMRSPNTATSTFPGKELHVQGSGAWNTGAGNGVGGIYLKVGTSFGTIAFPKLVLDGGVIASLTDSGRSATLDGEINVASNSSIWLPYDGSTPRSLRIKSRLTGTGNIEFRAGTTYSTTRGVSLDIAGTGNTFSGAWTVGVGTLVGSTPNALGTNSIMIGTHGALQANYPMNNPDALLVVDGRVNLTHAHTFKNVVVAGTPLNPGTYTFEQLNAAYPNQFPATWVGQPGVDTVTTATGSLTVLAPTAPQITVDPVASQKFYPGQTAEFWARALGSDLSYQWMFSNGGAYTPVADGGRFSGATTTNLVINGVTSADAGNYVMVAGNSAGEDTSAAANLTVLPVNPPDDITMSVVQGNPQDWEVGAHWSDGMPASVSSQYAVPVSTYRILPGAGMRTPASPATASFPGDVLVVDGNGMFTQAIAGSGIGAVIIKGASSGSTVHFPRLVMNGGEILNFINSGGNATLTGEIEVLANTPVFSADDTKPRSIRVEATLTGNGSIEYRGYPGAFRPADPAALTIANPANTYSGTWNVVAGTLVGSAPNALGNNDMTVGVDGALQTTYDIYSPTATLVLDGRLNLTGNHTFGNVVVAGTTLEPGTYAFADLNAAFPANFPETWTAQPGAESQTTATGTLTVGAGVPEPVLNFSVSGSGLSLEWTQGVLLEAPTLDGPWTPNETATSPYTVTPNPEEPQKFFRLMIP